MVVSGASATQARGAAAPMLTKAAHATWRKGEDGDTLGQLVEDVSWLVFFAVAKLEDVAFLGDQLANLFGSGEV
jgi:hypothetical protein